jgi:hypothetical protein
MEVRIKSTPMTTYPINTRVVQFAGNAIQFDVEHPDILAAIDAHFKHCLGVAESVLARYQVRAEGEAVFSVSRDDVMLQSNMKLEQVLFLLMQDGLTKLNGAASADLVFHSAALAYENRGLLLCGKSGSGKSTLTASLIAEGFQYLTDEVIALPAEGNEVRGFCRSLVLKSGSAFIWKNLTPHADAEQVFKMNDGSAWVPSTLFNPSAVRVSVEPQVVLFPTYSKEAEFKAERLTPANTLFHLMQCLVNARNFPDHGLERTKQLAQKSLAYRVMYSDLEQVSEWIRKTLTQ